MSYPRGYWWPRLLIELGDRVVDQIRQENHYGRFYR